MKHAKHLGISLVLGALIAAGLMVSPASAATTTGTWTQYPTGATVYQAEVQQPINTANTSNWNSKSKGAIPVMFKLSSGTGSAVFQSIYSDQNFVVPPYTGTGPCGFGTALVNANDCAYMSFSPSPGLTFSQIGNLQATYTFASGGNCHGGSLRWEIDTSQGNLFIYYGAGPNFTDCTTSNQSGVNMIQQTDARFDTSQIAGGTFYDTYAHALTLIGGTQIQDAALVLDSGWGGDQILTAGTTATVNDNMQTWNSGGTGGFTATCDLPAATIQVGISDPVADGPINEEPVQSSLVDSGNAFRVVDCKYQYILSIPSLPGAGTYYVDIKIGGIRVPTPASPGGSVKFDLK
jgi:hypothetical protein